MSRNALFRTLLLALAAGCASPQAIAQMRPEPPGVMPAEPSLAAPGIRGPSQPPPGLMPSADPSRPPSDGATSPQTPAGIAPPGEPPPETQVIVVDVKVSGNKAVPLSKILPSLRTRPGRPFDLEQIREDVRRLDNTHLFVNVRTFFQEVPGGRVVIFDVIERPLLADVLFLGNHEIHKKKLLSESKLKKGDAADPYAVEEARAKLEDLYHSRGFAQARVSLLEGNRPGDRRAIFLINEGVKQRIWWINFVGNTIADDGRLRTQIKSKTPVFYLFGGEFDRKQLDEDVERLFAYYRGLGFFCARIGRQYSFNDNENWVSVTFVIDEGPRFKVRNLSVIGNTKYTSDELLEEMKLHNGMFFNQAQMMADVAALQDRYGGCGYIFADIKADPRMLEEPGQLDLVYNIKEGDRYRVGKLNVVIKSDTPHTKLATVMERLSIKPGDIIDIREVRASERRLRASQLFQANPAQGNPPKIVFTPPGQETAEEEVAEKPKPKDGRGRFGRGFGRGTGGGDAPGPRTNGPDDGSTTFRGQSPDPTPRDRVIDVNVVCPPLGDATPGATIGLPSSAGSFFGQTGPATRSDDGLMRRAQALSDMLLKAKINAQRPAHGQSGSADTGRAAGNSVSNER